MLKFVKRSSKNCPVIENKVTILNMGTSKHFSRSMFILIRILDCTQCRVEEPWSAADVCFLLAASKISLENNLLWHLNDDMRRICCDLNFNLGFMHGIRCLMIARWKAIEQLRSKVLELNRGTPKTCFSYNATIFLLIIRVLSYFRCDLSDWIAIWEVVKQSYQNNRHTKPKIVGKKAYEMQKSSFADPFAAQFMCISISRNNKPFDILHSFWAQTA